MRFDIVTIFPEIFASFLSTSLVGKAVEAGLIEVNLVDPRDFTDDKHRNVDDTPYGGGDGMVLKAEPIVRAVESVKPTGDGAPEPWRVLLSPQGEPLGQAHLDALRRKRHVVLICGRYEGFDERVRRFVHQEISLGDFVLNGGEVAAMALVDGVARLEPGVLGNARSLVSESHADGLLEYPQYTRPREFRDLEVPEVLLSGDHERVHRWRRLQMMLRTRERRPDLWGTFEPSHEDLAALESADGAVPPTAGAPAAAPTVGQPTDRDKAATLALARRTYIALLHHPVYDRGGRIVTTAITNLDLHDIARSSRTFGLAGYFVVTPLSSQQELAQRIMAHWKEGHGAAFNENRREALELIEVLPDLEQVIARVETRHGARPVTIATSAQRRPKQLSRGDVMRWLHTDTPVLILMGTGWGLATEVLDRADLHMLPIEGPTDYNHLSVRSAAAIILDRFFGMRDES